MQKEEAITGCLTAEQERLYRLAYSYVKNVEDALDAMQTAAWPWSDRTACGTRRILCRGCAVSW